jgi:hypothetical protein
VRRAKKISHPKPKAAGRKASASGKNEAKNLALRVARCGCGSDEEIEEEEEGAEEEEESAPAEAALRELRDGMKEAGRDDAKTRLAPRFIERTGRNIAGKVSAEEREFVFHPEGKLFAMTPKKDGAEDKDKIAETSKKAESRS